MPLVGGAVPAAAPDDDRDVGEPLGKFVFEEGFAQFGDMVLTVGLQGPHELSGAPPGQNVVVGSVPNERLRFIELAARRAPAGDAVVELPGAGQLPVGSRQQYGLQAVVPQGQKLEPCAEIRGLAPASAARRIASRCCIHDMISRSPEKNTRPWNAPDLPGIEAIINYLSGRTGTRARCGTSWLSRRRSPRSRRNWA